VSFYRNTGSTIGKVRLLFPPGRDRNLYSLPKVCSPPLTLTFSPVLTFTHKYILVRGFDFSLNPRSQAPAWERTCNQSSALFFSLIGVTAVDLKEGVEGQRGNVGCALRTMTLGRLLPAIKAASPLARPYTGQAELGGQVRSQAGAWERGKSPPKRRNSNLRQDEKLNQVLGRSTPAKITSYSP